MYNTINESVWLIIILNLRWGEICKNHESRVLGIQVAAVLMLLWNKWNLKHY